MRRDGTERARISGQKWDEGSRGGGKGEDSRRVLARREGAAQGWRLTSLTFWRPPQPPCTPRVVLGVRLRTTGRGM